jgi:hypothetical protein
MTAETHDSTGLYSRRALRLERHLPPHLPIVAIGLAAGAVLIPESRDPESPQLIVEPWPS